MPEVWEGQQTRGGQAICGVGLLGSHSVAVHVEYAC